MSEDNSVFESISKTPLSETKALPRFAKGNDSLPLKLPNIISSFVRHPPLFHIWKSGDSTSFFESSEPSPQSLFSSQTFLYSIRNVSSSSYDVKFLTSLVTPRFIRAWTWFVIVFSDFTPSRVQSKARVNRNRLSVPRSFGSRLAMHASPLCSALKSNNCSLCVVVASSYSFQAKRIQSKNCLAQDFH